MITSPSSRMNFAPLTSIVLGVEMLREGMLGELNSRSQIFAVIATTAGA